MGELVESELSEADLKEVGLLKMRHRKAVLLGRMSLVLLSCQRMSEKSALLLVLSPPALRKRAAAVATAAAAGAAGGVGGSGGELAIVTPGGPVQGDGSVGMAIGRAAVAGAAAAAVAKPPPGAVTVDLTGVEPDDLGQQVRCLPSVCLFMVTTSTQPQLPPPSPPIQRRSVATATRLRPATPPDLANAANKRLRVASPPGGAAAVAQSSSSLSSSPPILVGVTAPRRPSPKACGGGGGGRVAALPTVPRRRQQLARPCTPIQVCDPFILSQLTVN